MSAADSDSEDADSEAQPEVEAASWWPPSMPMCIVAWFSASIAMTLVNKHLFSRALVSPLLVTLIHMVSVAPLAPLAPQNPAHRDSALRAALRRG